MTTVSIFQQPDYGTRYARFSGYRSGLSEKFLLESEWHENECYVHARWIDCDGGDRRMEWSEWKEEGDRLLVKCTAIPLCV